MLDDLLRQGLTVDQINQGFIRGDFELTSDELTRLGSMSTGGTPAVPGSIPLPPDTNQALTRDPLNLLANIREANQLQLLQDGVVQSTSPDLRSIAAIDALAAKRRTELFNSGLPSEEIVKLQQELRQQTATAKDEVQSDPGLGEKFINFISSGTDIGPIKVNIPLLTVGLTLATGGIAAGAFGIGGGLAAGGGALARGAGPALSRFSVGQSGKLTLPRLTPSGTRPTLPGPRDLAQDVGSLAKGTSSLLRAGAGKVRVPQFIRRHPLLSIFGGGGAAVAAGLILADSDSPSDLRPSQQTGAAPDVSDAESLIASIVQGIPRTGGPPSGGPPTPGSGFPSIDPDQFLPRFTEQDTPQGRVLITQSPQIVGGNIIGFETTDITLIPGDNKKEQRAAAKELRDQALFEQSIIEREQSALREQATFEADPGNRLRLQALQSLAERDARIVTQREEIGPNGGREFVIPGSKAGSIGALLGLDPEGPIPIAESPNQPFNVPLASSLSNLLPGELSELSAIAQVGFGQNLDTVSREANKKRFKGVSGQLATFTRR